VGEAGVTDEVVPGPDQPGRALTGVEGAGSFQDDVVFGLRGVGVQRVIFFARGKDDPFDIEGMSPVPRAGVLDATEGQRHVLPVDFVGALGGAAVFDRNHPDGDQGDRMVRRR
jgi:hypothetical protein